MADGATLATGEATGELDVGLGSTVASPGEAALLQDARSGARSRLRLRV